MDQPRVRLRARKDEDVGDDDVRRAGGAEEHHIGNIGGAQGLQPFVDLAGAVGIAAEAHQGELRLHQSGVDVDNPDAGAVEVDAQRLGEGAHGVLVAQ